MMLELTVNCELHVGHYCIMCRIPWIHDVNLMQLRVLLSVSYQYHMCPHHHILPCNILH